MGAIQGPFRETTGNSTPTPTNLADLVRFNLADATFSDPTNLTSSVSQDGDNITLNFDALTISNTPTEAVQWNIDVKNMFSTVGIGVDLQDMFRAVIRMANLVPTTDLWVGFALVSADGLRGMAWRLAAVAGDWQVQHTSMTAGSWAGWTVGASNGNTQALGGWCAVGTSGNQGRFAAYGMDAAGDIISAASVGTAAAQVNVANGFTKLRLCVGWIAGALGTNPTSVTFRAGHLYGKVKDTITGARFFQ